MKECCGNCKYYYKAYDEYEDYVCVNGESEYVADWTDYSHCCDEYEEREK